MRKTLLAAAVLAMMATPGLAQSYKFVIVPKAMNNPFFDFARDGCQKRAKEFGKSNASTRVLSNTSRRRKRRSSRTSSPRRWTASPSRSPTLPQ